MAKSEQTLLAEKWLIKRMINESKRFALEVDFGYHKTGKGKVDLLACKLTDKDDIPELYAYEIKTSVSDFKNVNGHNHVADYNYYVLSEDVWLWYQDQEKYMRTNYSNPHFKIGLLIATKRGLIKKREPERIGKYQKVRLHERLEAIDQIMLSWCNGTMLRYLRQHDIVLKNEPLNYKDRR